MFFIQRKKTIHTTFIVCGRSQPFYPVIFNFAFFAHCIRKLLKNSCAGPDGLFPKVLKALNSHITPVLARMFNLSLQTIQVPEDRRREIVTPVAKSPCTKDPRQFIPTSLTSVACKIPETILKE